MMILSSATEMTGIVESRISSVSAQTLATHQGACSIPDQRGQLSLLGQKEPGRKRAQVGCLLCTDKLQYQDLDLLKFTDCKSCLPYAVRKKESRTQTNRVRSKTEQRILPQGLRKSNRDSRIRCKRKKY